MFFEWLDVLSKRTGTQTEKALTPNLFVFISGSFPQDLNSQFDSICFVPNKSTWYEGARC